jgi:hypothetical protein
VSVRILQEQEDRRARHAEGMRRTRARKKGEDVPRLSPGPAKGYQFSPEVLAERQYASGSSHPQWTGDDVSEKAGRKRALKMYPVIGPCVRCGSENSERHHKDGNTANNAPDNIEALCRKCHMEEDGRLDSVRATPWRGCACR